jgi:hypothetical protein
MNQTDKLRIALARYDDARKAIPVAEEKRRKAIEEADQSLRSAEEKRRKRIEEANEILWSAQNQADSAGAELSRVVKSLGKISNRFLFRGRLVQLCSISSDNDSPLCVNSVPSDIEVVEE